MGQLLTKVKAQQILKEENLKANLKSGVGVVLSVTFTNIKDAQKFVDRLKKDDYEFHQSDEKVAF